MDNISKNATSLLISNKKDQPKKEKIVKKRDHSNPKKYKYINFYLDYYLTKRNK